MTFYSYEVLIWFGPKFLKTTQFSLEEVEAVKTAILKEYPSAEIAVYKTLYEPSRKPSRITIKKGLRCDRPNHTFVRD